ncbi:MAG: haloacid dehalogenase-like hydrolase [Congregibacter sp.]|nr:haloacid dehalogenase-like hydrolase [Congregibacter sp.]
MIRRFIYKCLLLSACGLAPVANALEPQLPSWNDSTARQAITSFVERVTDPQHANYVAPAERIAVFDNDGTLWSEQPVYFQLFFGMDRAAKMMAANPELAQQSPFKEVATGGMAAILGGGEEMLLKLIAATHGNVSQQEFDRAVGEWMETARHPTTGRPFSEMVYQPMLELMEYLRSNDFEVWIVSGGGVGFMRVWADEVYGVPEEQVIGSRFALEYVDGEIRRGTSLTHVNDKEGKPVGIEQQIGKRPIFAAGNSDGDFAMIEWTTTGQPASLGIIVHHTDAEREWAYDRESPIGELERGLDEAPTRGWMVIDMQKDWSRIYPAPVIQ